MGNRPSQSTYGRGWPRGVRDLFRSARQGNGAVQDRSDFSESGQSRSNRSDAQGHVSGQRSGSNGKKSWRDKLNSCPDLQGAAAKGLNHHQQQQQNTTMQPDLQAPTKLNYKIYRSYRCAIFQHDLRVYMHGINPLFRRCLFRRPGERSDREEK